MNTARLVVFAQFCALALLLGATARANVTSVAVPANATYKVGDALNFTVNYGENATVNTAGGTPSIGVTLDTGGTVNAAYISGSGTNALVFRYTVSAGNLDATGIALAGSIALNGGTITGPVDALTLTGVGATTAVLVDGVAPTVSSVNSSTANGSYKAGDVISVQVNFSESVVVTGTPTLSLNSGGTAIYSTGTGTSTLNFYYAVATGAAAADLDYSTTGSLALSGGSIKDVAGNNATLTLVSPNATNSLGANKNLVIDTTAPAVTGVNSVTANGTYKVNDPISIQVNFSESVVVTGTPTLSLNSGGTATFASGSTSSALTFSYTVGAGDASADLDYSTINSLALSGGTIKDAAGNNATLTLPLVGTGSSLGGQKSLVIDGTAPTVSSINRQSPTGASTNATSVTYRVTFSETVTGVDTTDFALTATGTATGTIASVSSVSGSVYDVTVNTVSGSGMLRLDLKNAGTGIADSAGNAIAAGFTTGQTYTVDSVAPTVANVNSTTVNGTFPVGGVISIQVNFSEAVIVTGTPTLTLETGTVDRTVNYASGSGTTALTFTYTIQAGDASADLDYVATTSLALNGGTIADAAGNNAILTLASPGTVNSLGANKALVIDAAVPTVTSVSVPASGSYKVGANLDFTVNFSEPITVGGTNNSTLGLTVGITAKTAVYLSSAASSVTYRYTVAGGDNDTDGIAVGSLTLNANTITDLTGNAAIVTLSGVGSTTGVLVDTTAPTVTSVSVPASGSYTVGANLDFAVNFSEAVTVTGTTSTLGLMVGSTSRNAAYLSNTGTSIAFRYVVPAGENDADGVALGTLILNGTTITDAAGNAANTTLNNISSTAGVLVNTTGPVAPMITAISAPPQVVTLGQSLTLSVTATGTPAPTYQWKRNGLPISGATAASYAITGAVSVRDNGWYQVVVTNSSGSTTSAVVFVNVAVSSVNVVGIGDNWAGQTIIPAGLSGVMAVAAGSSHGLVLKSDGTVIAWGDSRFGKTTVPAGLSGVVGLAAGDGHSLALKSDGTVIAWGYNGSGQTTIPAGLSGVVAVAGGGNHSLALKNDGTVIAWGHNGYGQTTIPADISGVVAVAAGSYHSLALRSDGTVIAWGLNDSGETTIPTGLSGVVALAGGGNLSLALKGDGTVIAWGSNGYGQTTIPAGLSGVVAVAAGYNHGVALKSNGTVVAWGDNSSGQTTIPVGLSGTVAVSTLGNFDLLLRDATGDFAPTITTQPTSRTANFGQVVTLSAVANSGGAANTYQWRKSGIAISGATLASYTIGEVVAGSAGSYDVVVTNYLGTVTSSAATLTVNAAPVVNAANYGRYVVGTGQSLTLTLDAAISSSATVQWKRNGMTLSGATARTLTIASATPAKAGYYQAVYNDGSGAVTSAPIFVHVAPTSTHLVGWGSNSNSQLAFPVGLTSAVAIATNSYSSFALKSDGTAVNWGNGYVPPLGLGNIVAITHGFDHNLALKVDGTVVQWGGTSISQASPPVGLANVVAITAGYNHSIALKADGTVIAWGNSNYGATAVSAGLAGVVSIAAGNGFSLALKSDGTVVGWGANDSGQSSVPVGLANVVGIGAGFNHSLALRTDGTVVSWGYNYNGQTAVPAGLSNVLAVAGGQYHSLALKADGTVVAWGDNSSGQTAPPAGLNSVFAIAAGSYHSLALRDSSGDLAPTITMHPASMTAFAGQDITLSVSATGGTSLLGYQWRLGGVPIAGATNATLVLPLVSAANGGSYDVVVSNQLGTVTSQTATLTISPAAAVSTNVTGRQTVAAGQSLTLTATAAISPPVTYQWRRNGQAILGATNASYVITSATWRDAGSYQVVAANGVGPVWSAPIFVSLVQTTQVVAWGNNGSGQTTGPAGLSGVVATAAGSSHSLALKSNGTVAAWGSNSATQINLPAGLANVVSIAANGNFSLALKGDGAVASWGSINYVPSGVNGTIAIAAGGNYAMALRFDGIVSAWTSGNVATDVPVGLRNVVGIAAGSNHRLALTSDGTVVAWGDNNSGQSIVPTGLANAVAVAAGSSHSLALNSFGTVVAWGYNGYGQTNVPAGLTGIVSIAASSNTSFAVKSDGTVVAWGANDYSLRTPPAGLSHVFGLAAGDGHALALRDASADTAPVIVTQPANQLVQPGQSATLSVAATGGMLSYQWRYNGSNISGPAPEFIRYDTPYLGCDSPTLYVNGLSGFDLSGSYDVVVSNYLGTVTSSIATLGVSSAPSLTLQPVGQAVSTGGTCELSVGVNGLLPFTYQWRKDGTAISGATNSTLRLTNFQPADAGSYDVVVTNSGGSVTSTAAVLIATSPVLPSITLHPAGATLNVTNVGSFGVTATGTAPLSYQWRKDGVAISGATGSVLMLGAVQASSAGSYDVVVSNSFGSVASDPARLIVNPASVTIVVQPVSVSLLLGSTATFSVSAVGTPSLPTYQWRKYGVPIAGATSATLSVSAAQISAAGTYDVVVSDYNATATSNSVTLAVTDAAPQITTQPVGGTVGVGGNIAFSVAAAGTAPLAGFNFQWRRDGVALTGETGASLVVVNAQTYHAGDYTLVVSNSLGNTTSVAARLNVVPRVVAYSARLMIDADGAIGVFSIEGTLAKKVLLRAVGPGLAPFGITGLPDPQLELFDSSGALVAINNDWSTSSDAAAISTTTAAVGAFALAIGGRDAAIVRTLSPGTYTARAKPASGGSGTGYLELYDADLATAPMSTLPYVAVRGRMAAGGGAVIGGLGSNGRGQRSYLVRAIGPALGLSGVLANPSMIVVRDGTLVGNNDDWDAIPAETTATTAATARVAAFALPAGGRDSAVVLTGNLHAGPCTVQVGGSDALGGVVLLELHDLDASRPPSFAPMIASAPVNTSAAVGEAATLRVLAHGTAPLSYQWRKDGVPIAGATAATLSLAGVQPASGGTYSVVVSNPLGTATSLLATLSVQGGSSGSGATHALVGGGYVGGSTVTITNTLSYTTTATSLGWTATLPAGWSFVADGGAAGEIKPAVGTTGTLGWGWATPSAGPVTFTYTVSVPAGVTGDQVISAAGIVRFDGSVSQPFATPNPLLVQQLTTHSADTNADFRLSLFELTRVIELYNTRNGTVRTGCYAVATSVTEDGFAIDSIRAGAALVTLSRYHSADTERNGKLSLLELTRVIELYNTRNGTVRTGEYHVQANTEDGFAPGL